MKPTLNKSALLLVFFAALTFMGCAGHNMNNSMDNSTDTMSQEKMDTDMKSMSGDAMQNMQNDDMENTMK